MISSYEKSHAVRLLPGDDLKLSVHKYVTERNIKAGWIVTGIGSLTTYNIRFANMAAGTLGHGYFEIVSLTGTVSENGSHLHICIADTTGTTIGGHLLPGCIIYTTAEIIITESSKYIFTREKDLITSSNELRIKEK